jgi:hypothetical protein
LKRIVAELAVEVAQRLEEELPHVVPAKAVARASTGVFPVVS